MVDLAHKKAVQIPGIGLDEPYTPGILTHDLLFVSAMLGRDLETGEMASDSSVEVRMALDNVGKVLSGAGLGFEHMVFVNPYLK